jgi:hypothetical protein
MTQPTVGQIVHYVSHGTPVREDGTQAYTARCRAAIITEVTEDSDLVGLVALNPTGMFFHSLADGGCTLDEGQVYGGTWHWPERV